MKIPLLLATRNPGKLREMQALLADLPIEPILLPEDAPEVAETEDTFAGNAEIKARAAARCWVLGGGCSGRTDRTDPTDQTDCPVPNTQHSTPNTPLYVLADDSGLEVDALGGAPGVLSARYAGPHGSDAACVAKLLEALRGVPDAARAARFRCAMALLAPDGRLSIVEGTLE